MPRCKPPCLAWVNKAAHEENVGRIVSVHTESMMTEGGILWWLVSSGEPMKGCHLATGQKGADNERWEKLWCKDSSLTPINDPGIDTTEKDIPAPKQEWEFPKENANV
jgi:hypothetical protein